MKMRLEGAKRLFDELARERRFNSLNDFYSLSKCDIPKQGRDLIRDEFRGSVGIALQSLYPQHDWMLWKFKDNVSYGFWKNPQNGKNFMDWLGISLGFQNRNDWYTITKNIIRNNGGNGLLARYGNSRSALLSGIYSDHPWDKYKFTTLYWNQSHRNFMEWLGRQLGFQKMEDWYSVTYYSICSFGGKGLLSKYGNSPSKLLISVFPDHNWVLFKFQSVPMGFWMKENNCRGYLDWLGEQLGFQSREDWYNISTKDICDRGGHRLLAKYGNSPAKMVQSVYADDIWFPWKFSNSKMYQLDQQQRLNLIDWLQSKLQVISSDHWHRLSLSQIGSVVSLQIFRKYPLELLLKEKYPQINWDINKISIKTYSRYLYFNPIFLISVADPNQIKCN
jgi:hypothetical protein